MNKLRLLLIGTAVSSLVLVLSLGGSQNPHGDITLKCETCHTSNSWTTLRTDGGFSHQDTGFPLIGAHAQTPCASCHRDLRFTETKDQCADCHSDIHRGKLGSQCQSCHTSESWENRKDLFDKHADRGFPLIGVHATADCNACHQNALRDDFAGTPMECAGCHEDGFKATTDPSHVLAGFSTQCETCHSLSVNTWNSARYEHPPEFRLEGGHANLECIACHRTQFAGTVGDCISCHEQEYETTPDPDHEAANFDQNCLTCHNVQAWSPANFDHAITGFALTGGHAAVACADCHSDKYTGTSNACYSCHSAEFAAAAEPDHDANGFDHDCTTCHNTTAWQPSTFDHAATQFALTGAHQSLDCASCHSSGYTSMATDCYSCHSDNFASVGDPDHIENNFDHDCQSCHTTTAWTPVEFDHTSTGFLLTGGHAAVDCAGCHSSGFNNTSADCYSCHTQDFGSVMDPNHITNGFPHLCAQCHTTSAWSPAEPRGFDHTVTGFLLTGAHAGVACLTCHTNGFTDTSPQCYSCHSSDFTAAVSPNHQQNNFDHDCSTCHTTTAWEPATFDHNQTAFPLTAGHAGVACLSCHAAGYTNTSTACFSCHQGDFASAAEPNHQQNNFDHNCTSCHNTTAWQPSTFDHGTTGFALTGAHSAANCISCHAAGYVSTPADCYSCHSGDFASATDPNHAQNNFDHNCVTCHTTTAWEPASFDHASTDFPLTGAHTGLQCISCHASGYVSIETSCVSCHQQSFDTETNPKHTLAGFNTECQSCHSTTAWDPSNWSHATTGFTLTGAHVSADCQSCHATAYAGTASDCYSCHQGDFTSATDPNHAQNNFDHNCATCHSTTAWEPATFDHSTTGFLLTGGHSGIACLTCHATGYTNTSNACYSCHSGDFASVTDPNHVQNDFDHNCATCHSTTAWEPATFNHSSTSFPLTGTHTTLQCIACHSQGYVNTLSACYDCHSGDFAGATDPNHVQNNFSHLCTECHMTTAWEPATFNHSTTSFPLTGAHTALQCIACHSQGYVNTPSACYDCHTGDFASVTDPNHVQNNFSHLCSTCHSTTAWSPATFNHATTDFPLTGAHVSLQCLSCHASGYTGTPTDCYSCHQSAYNSTTDPSHSAAQFPTDCESCHTTTAWSPANWDHDTQYFPIYTGKHRNEWDQCSDCHTNSTNFSVFECILCHEHNKTKMDDTHQDEQGYQYNSNACYNCHPDGRS